MKEHSANDERIGDGKSLLRSKYSREYIFLHAKHIALLKAAAILPEVSRERGYRTVTSRRGLRSYGFGDAQCRAPALLMPLYGVDGRICGYQIDPDEPGIDVDGNLIRSECSIGPKLLLDVPPVCRPALSDSTIPLYLTTGVRAADSAASNGLCCVDLVADWSRNERIKRFARDMLGGWGRIPLDNRIVRIVLDSRAMAASSICQVLLDLRQPLRQRGAQIQLIHLGQEHSRQFGPGMSFALNDFFAHGGTIGELERLAQQQHSQAIITHTSANCTGSAELPGKSDLLDQLLTQASGPEENVTAQYLKSSGVLVYAVPLANRLVLLESNGEIHLREPEGNAPTRVTLSPSVIRRFRDKERAALPDLLDRIHALLTSHICFAEEWQPGIIALWIVGTYVHALFPFYGYLHITSPAKRSGKSLLLELLSELCFNATRVVTDPSPAFLFRDAELNHGTQLFDEVERLGNADCRSRHVLMSMLNVGFKRGGMVARVTDAKSNTLREFNVYVPRVLAGISQLSDTLADRSFRIELVRKRLDDHPSRFSPLIHGERLTLLRDDLHLAGLQHAGEIGDLFGCSDRFPLPEGADDRLRDILEPLFAIAAAADLRGRNEQHMRTVVNAARVLSSIRSEHDSGDAAIVAALEALITTCQGAEHVVLSASGALMLFREHEELRWVHDREAARALLRRLGLRSAIHRRERFWAGERALIPKITARGYALRLDQLHDLLVRYSGTLSGFPPQTWTK